MKRSMYANRICELFFFQLPVPWISGGRFWFQEGLDLSKQMLHDNKVPYSDLSVDYIFIQINLCISCCDTGLGVWFSLFAV